ncbi:MAG: T9SS type A sorting domain-containing protein [Cryomorphaceae bacterium]
MKKVLFIALFASLALSHSVSAQNNILLKINHVLDGEDFAFNTASETPDGRVFDLDRMEYYISEISVTHDGGMVTAFEDLWILVDASYATNEFLGQESIEVVESVSFSIGVDPDHNHLDPSSWPSGHPLYHQSPSMHWGWTAGYRFVAMEGMGSENLNQVFEIHALGDENYFENSVDLTAEAENGNITIALFADYAQALKGVNTDNGLISHGSTGSSITVLENFRDHVFASELQVDSDTNDTVPEIPAGIHSSENNRLFAVYPNPAENGTIQITSLESSTDGMLSLYDLAGNLLSQQGTALNKDVEWSGVCPGVYLIRYTNLGLRTQQIQKVVVH